MRLLLLLSMALAAACSDGQAASQPNSSDTHRVSAPVDSAVPLAGRVTDAANILDEEFELALSERLDRFEEVTKHQMVVVTVSSLEGRDVTDFTRDLANGWGIGRKDHNDGVVVLVAPNERKTRIAVGSGLEAAIPDSACQAIIENRMLPRFRKGEFAEGIEAGVDALIDELGRHS